MGSSIESERNLPGRTSKRKRWRGVGDHLGRHIGRHLGRHLGGSGIVEFADGFVHFDASQRSNVYFYLFYFFCDHLVGKVRGGGRGLEFSSSGLFQKIK